jgi:hypothetical protein
MNDFGLDLAVIGNGRRAALVDPSSRIVWWCYPRFDGDPIFSCPRTDELWGNFPQTYSMAGLILTAMQLWHSWEDRFWRG